MNDENSDVKIEKNKKNSEIEDTIEKPFGRKLLEFLRKNSNREE